MEEVILAILIILVIFLIYFLRSGTEGFISTPDAPTADADDLGLSEYDNISLANDVDTMRQRTFYNGGDAPESQEYDNSDVVAQAVSRGNTVFQPALVQGVTSTSNASMSAFELASPSGLPYFDEAPHYDIPLTGAYDMDEALARKQQHRGAINKKATEGRVRSTRNVFQKYFTNELDENSNYDWWDDSAAENLETDFGPDISPF